LTDITELRRRLRARVDAGATLAVPKLFDWYAVDFGGKRGVLEFVLAHTQDEGVAAAAERHGLGLRLRYAEFDWTLNAA